MPAKNLNVAKEVAALERMTAKQLRERFAEVFGETTNANKAQFDTLSNGDLQFLFRPPKSSRGR